MRLLGPRAPRCDETTGPALIDRIARLQTPHRVHKVRWRWSLQLWDNLRRDGYEAVLSRMRRKPRRRGVPVS